MNRAYCVILPALFASYLSAQGTHPEAVTKAQRAILDRVKVGMTPAEVRGIAGKPDIVRRGFPQDENFERWVGQLGYSTWVYSGRIAKEDQQVTEEPRGTILSRDASTPWIVNEPMYKLVSEGDTLYISEVSREPILPEVATAYRDEGNAHWVRTDIVTKKRSLSKRTMHIETTSYQPIVFVIFETGTFVVSGVRPEVRNLGTHIHPAR